MERRRTTRSLLSTEVEIARPGGEFQPVELRNMSIRGLYACTSGSYDLGDTCEVRISLLRGTDMATISTRGTVVRKDAEGIAIEFVEIDGCDFEHVEAPVRT